MASTIMLPAANVDATRTRESPGLPGDMFSGMTPHDSDETTSGPVMQAGGVKILAPIRSRFASMSRGLPTAPEACRHDGMRRWTDHVHSWHARSPWMQGRGDGFSFRSEYRPLRQSGAFSATTEEAITFDIAEEARRG